MTVDDQRGGVVGGFSHHSQRAIVRKYGEKASDVKRLDHHVEKAQTKEGPTPPLVVLKGPCTGM